MIGISEKDSMGGSAVAREEPWAGNCFVATYPPFSLWNEGHVPIFDQVLEIPAAGGAPLGMYVHIPFCRKKCDYCYYLSYIGQKPEVVNGYLEGIIRELGMYAGRPGIEGRKISFVYFGGGTPSTLSEDQVEMLGNSLRGILNWDEVREITFECAPKSVRAGFLKSLRGMGVTRLSMGVQSFDDELLKLNGRIHLGEDVVRAYSMIEEAGFDCVNLDLMAGLMGETDEKWDETVRQVIELGPSSVTVYQTEIPYNTKLYRDLEGGHLPAAPVSWEVKRERVGRAFAALEGAGYTVVSAYAAVKDAERQRFLYQNDLWQGGDMLGLGVASFGYVAGVHSQNHATLEEYLGALNRGEMPVKRAYALHERDRLVREFILQLKLGRVEAAPFREKFGISLREVFGEVLAPLEGQGFVRMDGDAICLTRQGLLRADRLVTEFYDVECRNLRYT
jgi:oxygen-independent coproporphyrinogen-3 oxidase